MKQDEFNLNREGQADGGHTEHTKYLRNEELQDEFEPEPSSSLDMSIGKTTEIMKGEGQQLGQLVRVLISAHILEEASTSEPKHKKHKAEKHRKHSHDLSASAAVEQSTEVRTESKKNKKNKEKKEGKEKHRKHSHDLSATAAVEEQTQTDTKSQKKKEKKEKKQKKKEEEARRKSKDLTTAPISEQPSPMDAKVGEQNEEKAKKHSQVKVTASVAIAPPIVEATPKKQKAEKKRKSSLLPMTSVGITEQDAPSVESKTTVPVTIEIASEGAIPTQNEVEELAGPDNIISALFPKAESTSVDANVTALAADVSDGAEEFIMPSNAETESSPEVEATVTTAMEEPSFENHLGSGPDSDIEEEDVEATVIPTVEEPSFSKALDSGSNSDIEEEDVEATVTPTMEEPSFSKALDSGSNSGMAEDEEEVEESEKSEEAEAMNVAIGEELPDAQASSLPLSSIKATPQPDVGKMEIQASPVEEWRELSFEPQTSSTPIMINSPDINAGNEMEIDTQLEQNSETSALEQDMITDEGPAVEKDSAVSASQVEESEEVITSQVILPPSGISTPPSQFQLQPSKQTQEHLESPSSEDSSEDSDDDDDDNFGFGAFTKSEADNQEQTDKGYLQTSINILDNISNRSAKSVDVKAVAAAKELRKVCDEEFKSRLTRAIKNGEESVKPGKEMRQLKAAQLGDEDDEDHPTSGLLPGFMSKSRAPTLSEIYANSQRYIYKSIHGRSPPPSPSRR
jgi:hypothetical protein